MTVNSAGLLAWRCEDDELLVFLVHMGGPFWSGKESAAWSVPKGLYEADEDPYAAARREFTEEVGAPAPAGDPLDLGTVRSGTKVIRAYAVPAGPELSFVASNTFSMEWPPRSGRTQEFPEADRGEWLALATARQRIVRSQVPFLDRLAEIVGHP